MERLFRLISDMHPKYKRMGDRRFNASTPVAATRGGRGKSRRVLNEPAPEDGRSGRSNKRSKQARGAGGTDPAPGAGAAESTSGPTLAEDSTPDQPRSLQNKRDAPNNYTSGQTQADERNNTQDLRLSINQSQQLLPSRSDVVTIPPDEHVAVTDTAVPTAIEQPESSARCKSSLWSETILIKH